MTETSHQKNPSSKHRHKHLQFQPREWVFKVHCHVNPGETVCLTGNVPELGDWNHERAVNMIRVHQDDSVLLSNVPSRNNSTTTVASSSSAPLWTVKVTLPGHRRIEYRYFVCMLVDNTRGSSTNEKLHIVRRWETNLNPRRISHNDMPSSAQDREAETFGAYDGGVQIDHGWLTSETVIQFKLANEPLRFWRNKYKNAPIRLKMVTMNWSRQNSVTESVESNSMDYLDSTSNSYWPITEIAVMNEEKYEMKLQDQFGRAYMIDFYMENNTDIPTHIGFCHILPLNFKQSVGTVVLPITSMKQEPLGQITIEYVIVRPMPDCPCDLKVSYAHYWKQSWIGLDVGHRGSGNSAKAFQACANLRENTIASLAAAADRGADFVEFDVQLSKDLIPVLWHDFYVNIGLEQKMKKGGEMTTLTVPMKDLTLAQLHELKGYLVDTVGSCCILSAYVSTGNHEVFHVGETPAEADTDLSNDHDPFPTLEHALQVLNPHVGFNVEIKWTMQLKDGSWELENPIELNMYLDIVLSVVLKHAGTRKIVFSCFHPDICTMIRFKQNKYPVLFLTQGVTQKYPEYNDPRTQNIPIAIQYALSSNILGLSIHTEDILRDPSQVQQILSHGLVVFCWGEDNNNKATIKYLKELGLNGIIYDRIEDHITDQKTNIFLIEDNERLLSVSQFTLLIASKSSVFSPSMLQSPADFDEDEDDGVEDGDASMSMELTGSNEHGSNTNGNENGIIMASADMNGTNDG